jgi:hypothetical protein
MLSKASFISVIVCVLVIALLSGCSQSPTGNVVITQQAPEGPKDVVINSTPTVSQPASQPAANPSSPSPVPVSQIPTNVLPRPEPVVIIIPENKPAADPVQACVEDCESSCEISASFSCSKNTGAECRMSCGSIIDTSACSTACSFKSAHACEPKFIEFCTAQCIGKCH